MKAKRLPGALLKRALSPLTDFRPRSLTGRLTVSLVVATVVVSIVSMSVSFVIEQRHVMTHLQDEADKRITMLVQVLEMPLWNFDYDHIEDISKSLMNGLLVKKISVYDSGKTALFTASREIKAESVTRASSIFHDGQEVGYVEITLASDYPAGFIGRFFLLPTSLVLLINLAIVTVAVAVLLPRFLAKPLRQISAVATAYGAGECVEIREGEADTEFQPVVSVLSQMAVVNRQHIENLEREIALRKAAEQRISRLNSVLKVVRDVNQLITREKDRQNLIQESCNILARGNVYDKAWTMLLDEQGSYLMAASAGLGKNAITFVKQLETGDYPVCVRDLLAQEEPVVVYYQPGKEHERCVLAVESIDEVAIRGKLEYEGTLHGVLGVSFPIERTFEDEEKALFLELAGDIAFALATIQRDEERRAARERHETIVRTSLDGFLVIDAQGRLLEVNDAYCRLTGFSREELLTKSIQDMESSETREATERHIQRVLAIGSDRFETKHRRRNGEVVDVEVSVNYLDTENLMFAFVRDVTQRKKAEERVRIAEQNYRNSLDDSPLGIRIVSADGELLYANRAILDIYGYSNIEEMRNTPARQRYTPESYAEHQKRRELRRQGKPVPSEYEISIVRKDGEVRHLSVNRKEVLWDGKVQFQTIYRDITEWKVAEEERRRQNEFLQSVLDSLSHPFYVIDVNDYTIRMANAATHSYYSSEDRHCYAVTHKRSEPCANREEPCPIMEVKRTRKPVVVEHVHHTTDGSPTVMEVHGYPIFDAEGNVVQMIEYTLDISDRKRAEEALRRSEELLKKAQKIGKIGSWEYDVEHQTITWSEETFGLYERDPKLGPPTPEEETGYYSAEQAKVTRDYSARAIESGQSFSFDVEVLLPSGRRAYYHSVMEPVTDSEGKVTRLSGTVQDITERWQAEEMFRLLAESSPVGIYIVQQGKFVYTNPQFQEDTGYAEEELLGRESLSLVEPEYRSLVREKAIKMLKGETTLPYDYRLVTRTGEVRWSSEILASVDYQGRKAAVGTYQDITERKRAEEELVRLNQAVETSGEAIFVTDKEGIITYVNPEFTRLYGYHREEVVGKVTPRILKSGTLAPEEYDNFWNTLLNRQAVSGELVNKTKDGRLVTIENSASPIINDQGEIIGFLAVQRDITEAKKMQQHLMVNDRLAALGQLVSGVAHELNNPLTGVIGFSSLLAGKKDLPEDIKEDISIINREAQRTANIVKNLLTFARKQPKDKQPTDVNNAIESVLELRAYEQRVSNIIVSTQLAPDLPEIIGNAFDLQQVFLNIIVNAEQAMLGAHGRGNLTITTERHGDIIRATVSDDGPGIAPENLKRIFDPFFTTKEVGKGTGLGLSICHGIVTEHNGVIYAESEPGKGATLVVELPISNAESEEG